MVRKYTIADLLVDTYYSPVSVSRRGFGGVIDFAEKAENVSAPIGVEVYRVRYSNQYYSQPQWATVAVEVPSQKGYLTETGAVCECSRPMS